MVRWEGAKGPRSKERANRRRRDLRGSDWRKKREREMRMEERETEMNEWFVKGLGMKMRGCWRMV